MLAGDTDKCLLLRFFQNENHHPVLMLDSFQQCADHGLPAGRYRADVVPPQPVLLFSVVIFQPLLEKGQRERGRPLLEQLHLLRLHEQHNVDGLNDCRVVFLLIRAGDEAVQTPDLSQAFQLVDNRFPRDMGIGHQKQMPGGVLPHGPDTPEHIQKGFLGFTQEHPGCPLPAAHKSRTASDTTAGDPE